MQAELSSQIRRYLYGYMGSYIFLAGLTCLGSEVPRYQTEVKEPPRVSPKRKLGRTDPRSCLVCMHLPRFEEFGVPVF